MEVKPLKITYKEIGSFEFATLFQKLTNTPTSTKNACHIAQVAKRINKALEQMKSDYQSEVVEKFAKRDESGAVIRPENEPKGYEPIDGSETELSLAHDKFGARTFDIDWRPLTPGVLSDMKLSAKEIHMLGVLFNESEEGPGVPHLRSL